MEYLPPLGGSDHICLKFNFYVELLRGESNSLKYQLNAGNFNETSPTSHNTEDMTTELARKYFSKQFNNIVSQIIPYLQ